MKKKTLLLLGLFTMAASSAMAGTVDRLFHGSLEDSQHHSIYQMAKDVFDGDSATKWLTDAKTGWVQIGFKDSRAYVINSYAITSADDASDRDPRSWSLLGSNDGGANWDILDSRSGETWGGRKVMRNFACPGNTTAYSLYRLDVTQNNGSSNLTQFSELELFEDGVSRTAYGQVSRSSEYRGNEGGGRAFDGRIDTKWLSAKTDITPWLQYQFLGKRAYAINTYAITSGNDDVTRDPKSWTLNASNDGINWVVLDTKENESWDSRLQRHEFTINNRDAYAYYMLDVTANNGSVDFVQFAELELKEVTPDGSVVYTAPIEEAVEVPLATSLNWTAGTAQNILGYYVYMGTSPEQLDRLNETILPKAATQYAVDLESDLTYYWQVEEINYTDPNGLSGVTYPIGDPNNVTAGVWHFSTKTSIVSFEPTSPVDSVVFAGESATFSVVASDPLGGEISYQWYFDTDPNTLGDGVALTDGVKYAGCNTATLTVNNTQETDLGLYYCGGLNASNRVQYSDSAEIIFKEQLAHWDLDAADYDGTYYVDISGKGNDATVDGTPVFVDGIVDGDQNSENAVTDGAVYFTTVTGTASVGTFNPSAGTDMFTIAAWVMREDVVNDVSFNMIASKRDGWSASDQSYWQFMVTNGGVVRLQSYGLSTVNTPELILADEWHHVAVTYQNNFATIYVDGEVAAEGGFLTAEGSEATFRIGRNDAETERFEGALDDMQVFNYALAPEEIVDIYYAETGKAICVYGNPQGDVNSDCAVNILDFSIMAGDWLQHGFYPVQP